MPFDAIEIYRGNKRRIRIYVRDPDLNIIDLTGAECTFTVRHTKSGPILLQKKTSVPAEGQIGAADEGEAFFFILAEDTQNLDVAQYVYDVTVMLSGDGPYTVAEGVVNLVGPVGNTFTPATAGPIVQGSQGPQGWQGPQGLQGNQGLAGVGSQGPQGNQGFQSVAGSQGNQGWQGFQGSGTADLGWVEINASHYTATPASTSTLTMVVDDTATLLAGLPLRYTIGGTVYYGQITACAANLLTVRGAPLGGDVTKLEVGTRQMLESWVFTIPGLFEDATNTALLASDLFIPSLTWPGAIAYCVGFDYVESVADSGVTQPNVNVRWGGNRVSTANGGAGPLCTASELKTVVDIDTTNYVVSYGEAIEVECTKGTNGNASDLTIKVLMVKP